MFLKPFCFLFIPTSVAAFLLYFGVGLLIAELTVGFSPVIVTDGYHGGQLEEITEHPFAFLLTISFIFSLLGASWLTVIEPKYKRFQSLQLLILPWIALILTSPLWGVIWSVYHWPPQDFSSLSTMIYYYQYDALFGLRLGWLSAIYSFPINILSYISVCALLFVNKKLFFDKSMKR